MLLTQDDVAKRWQLDIATITNYRKQGILTPCNKIPAIRFTEQHIADMEGVKLERFSPLERKRMEQEIDKLKFKNAKLQGIISQILTAAAPIISIKED